jgi:hypothetical protein
MSTSNTYLAVFLGSKDGAQAKAWAALSEAERATRSKAGAAAWGEWVQKHRESILELGGPLGKTKVVNSKGIADITNMLAAFTLVRAESHEAAARLFEKHPHFSIFPGDSVEIMPIKPIPAH